MVIHKRTPKKIKKKERKAIAKGKRTTLGMAVLMFDSALTGGGSKEAGRSQFVVKMSNLLKH